MAVKSLRKVQKRISKKKKSSGGTPALHVDSRDSKRLRRAAGRHDKLVAQAAEHVKHAQPFLDRVVFFRDAADALDADADTAATSSAPPPPPASQLFFETVQRYLARHDAAIAQLASTRRANRPPPTHLVALEARRAREHTEHAAGLWVPDVRDAETRMALRGWSGEWGALAGNAAIKFVRVDDRGKVAEAQFPPGRE